MFTSTVFAKSLLGEDSLPILVIEGHEAFAVLWVAVLARFEIFLSYLSLFSDWVSICAFHPVF